MVLAMAGLTSAIIPWSDLDMVSPMHVVGSCRLRYTHEFFTCLRVRLEFRWRGQRIGAEPCRREFSFARRLLIFTLFVVTVACTFRRWAAMQVESSFLTLALVS